MRLTGILALICFLLAGCQAQVVKPQKLKPDNFETRLNSITAKVLVDVRSKDEFAEGHLPKALLIDYYSNDFKVRLAALDKTKPVFVYCGTGRRSAGAADILIKMGFRQVYDLEGGFSAWVEAKKKTEK